MKKLNGILNIKLNHLDGSQFFLNANMIESVDHDYDSKLSGYDYVHTPRKNARIKMNSGVEYMVKQTPTKVNQLINESKKSG